jgi:hypothetical protein
LDALTRINRESVTAATLPFNLAPGLAEELRKVILRRYRG